MAETMKTILYSLLLIAGLFISCSKEKAENTPEAKVETVDSIRCVQAWQNFQLLKDTILTLHYQQPVKLVNSADTMAVTVTRISDVGTQEEERTNDFSEAKVWVQVSLNGKCTYQTKYGLMIRPRSDHPYFEKFGDAGCKHYSSDSIYDGPSDVILVFYNTLVILNQLTPFAKNTQELYDLAANPQKYTVTLWLKKRCF